MTAQVLPLFPRLAEQPRIVFGRAFVYRLVERAAGLTAVQAGDIIGRSRNPSAEMARYAVMAVARERGKTLIQIGSIFDGRDHTSVRSACIRAMDLEQSDKDFAELVRLLREEAAQ